VDEDGDGYGGVEIGSSCEQPADSVALGGDCDDTDDAVHPGATDIPDDGIDQDCNGADRFGGTGDTGSSADTDPREPTPPTADVTKGCAHAGGGAGWLALAGLAAAAGRRRGRA
jgi:MYXO-CTERM domain-containing protein